MTVMQNAADCDVSADEEHVKRDMEMQTLVLTYLTAKMEHNTRKFKAEAEAHILAVMEEEEELRKKVQEKKRQYLLEKKRQLNDLLDLQIAALTPVAAAAAQFREDYRSFAVAVDSTRHELPIKNVYIEGDRREFLNKAEACLKESEGLLLQVTQGEQKDNQTSAECLRGLKAGAQDVSEQLSGGVSELLELSSLVNRQTVLKHQSLEEEQLGLRAKELYCPAPKR